MSGLDIVKQQLALKVQSASILIQQLCKVPSHDYRHHFLTGSDAIVIITGHLMRAAAWLTDTHCLQATDDESSQCYCRSITFT